MNKINRWMRAATTAQQEQLAKLAYTSRKAIYNIAEGVRGVSAAKAIVFEKAIRRVTGWRKLPVVTRGDLCAACKTCEYARRCIRQDQEKQVKENT
jgi:tryptophan synthase alpha subunit